MFLGATYIGLILSIVFQFFFPQIQAFSFIHLSQFMNETEIILELSKQFRTLIHGFKPTVSHYLILPSGQSQKYIKETGGKCLRSGYLCLPYNEGCYSSRRTITYQILFCTLFPGISVHKILRYVSIIFHQGDLSYLYVLKHRT